MSAHATCPAAQRARIEEETPVPDACAIIAAGGIGSRFGDARGKQYVDLAGLPVASWSVIAFDRAPSFGHIVIVCPEGRVAETQEKVVAPLTLSTPVTWATSGATRQESVLHGLEAMPEGYTYVAVHDAARPLIEVEAIERTVACLRGDGSLAGAICAARVTDTLKLVEGDLIVSTPDRSFYWAAQTPQTFRSADLLAAHRAAVREGYVGTDDASLVEHAGGRVKCVETTRDNIKVTLPEDLAFAESALRARLGAEGCGL